MTLFVPPPSLWPRSVWEINLWRLEYINVIKVYITCGRGFDHATRWTWYYKTSVRWHKMLMIHKMSYVCFWWFKPLEIQFRLLSWCELAPLFLFPSFWFAFCEWFETVHATSRVKRFLQFCSKTFAVSDFENDVGLNRNGWKVSFHVGLLGSAVDLVF